MNQSQMEQELNMLARIDSAAELRTYDSGGRDCACAVVTAPSLNGGNRYTLMVLYDEDDQGNVVSARVYPHAPNFRSILDGFHRQGIADHQADGVFFEKDALGNRMLCHNASSQQAIAMAAACLSVAEDLLSRGEMTRFLASGQPCWTDRLPPFGVVSCGVRIESTHRPAPSLSPVPASAAPAPQPASAGAERVAAAPPEQEPVQLNYHSYRNFS